MNWLRALLALLLITSAQTATGPLHVEAGQMVICTGTGPVTVPMDAKGPPTSPHLCPDCLHALTGLPPDPTPVLLRAADSAPLRWRDAPLAAAPRPTLSPPARAPPVLV